MERGDFGNVCGGRCYSDRVCDSRGSSLVGVLRPDSWRRRRRAAWVCGGGLSLDRIAAGYRHFGCYAGRRLSVGSCNSLGL